MVLAGCAIATPWVVGTAAAFEADVAWLRYLLSGVPTAVASIVSVTHYCIQSVVYGFLFGRRAKQVVD